jgi:hypothetical protein
VIAEGAKLSQGTLLAFNPAAIRDLGSAGGFEVTCRTAPTPIRKSSIRICSSSSASCASGRSLPNRHILSADVSAPFVDVDRERPQHSACP